jgi:thiol-disulfide isomerase/thioredoxin
MRLTALSLAFLFPTSVLPAALKHGEPAPPIAVSKWVRGEAVDLKTARENKVVVVEFWATWCGPCRASIPHLTELQKKQPKDLVIIGVTREDPQNSLAKVEAFVKDWGDKIGFTIAFDDAGKTYEAYMTATGQQGIPTAFIVDKAGKLAWLGHPMEMDKPLEQVLAGTFDIQKAAREHELRLQTRELQQSLFKKLVAKDVEGARKEVEKLAELARDNASTLNDLSWILLTHPAAKGHFNQQALAAATRCHELTKGENWMFLDTLALAKFETGKQEEAVQLQRQAIELAGKANAPEPAIAEFKERLELFEKGAKKEEAEKKD